MPKPPPVVYKTAHYTDKNGRDHIDKWLRKMPDKSARAAIAARLSRLEGGNFGDCRPLRDGVWELRVDVGPGYRVYYARAGRTVVLLLTGGDKRTQAADIARACEFWLDWQQREGEQ